MRIFSIENIKGRQRRRISGLIGVPTMNILEDICKKNSRKRMLRSSRDKNGARRIGTCQRKLQIKTTAKYFLFFCLFISVTMGQVCPMVFDVYAEAVPPLPTDFADIDLSDILITFPAGAGAGIKNTTVLNDLYTNYGVSGWGVGDMTPYFDIVVSATGESAGLSNSVLNEHLGDNEWFDENGYDIKVKYDQFKQKLDATETLTQYGANYIHQATLSPSTGNPWEWDWSEILEEYFRTGLIGFEHVFLSFDTLNDIAVTMDDVLSNVYNFWTPNIANSVPINEQINNAIGSYGSGLDYILMNSSQGAQFNYDPEKVYICCYMSSGDLRTYVCNLTNETQTYGRARPSSSLKTSYTNSSISAGSRSATVTLNSTQFPIKETNMDVYSSKADADAFVNSVIAGTESITKYSPDVINPRGNISVEDFPSMSPSIEQGQAMRPIPQQAYQNWAQTNNLADPAENGALMGALVAPYIEAEPAPAPSPAPDDPWADPVPDTEPANRPVSPEQPDFPEEPELTAEQIDESLLGATPDLTEIFPFCIPWDIARILKQFTANRRAPYIEWTLESDLFGFSYTFEIDMAIFDDVAVILRLLELIGFILGLAILTRYLIGAS